MRIQSFAKLKQIAIWSVGCLRSFDFHLVVKRTWNGVGRTNVATQSIMSFLMFFKLNHVNEWVCLLTLKSAKDYLQILNEC
jgi:hypothetical protein